MYGNLKLYLFVFLFRVQQSMADWPSLPTIYSVNKVLLEHRNPIHLCIARMTAKIFTFWSFTESFLISTLH